MKTKMNCSLTGGAISIELENYYTIFYNNWYIGRMIECDKNSEMCKIKFLHETDIGFKWTSAEQMVGKKKYFIWFHLTNGKLIFPYQRSIQVLFFLIHFCEN